MSGFYILKLTLYVVFSFMTCSVDAVDTLTSSPSATNGAVTVCPGAPLSLICSHDNTNSAVTRWIVTGTTSQNCDRVVAHRNPSDDTCGPFSITMISELSAGTPLTSTARLDTVSNILNGARVECFNSGGSQVPVGVVTIQVVDPTPSASNVTYSVETATTGRLVITADSPGAYGTAATYSGSVVEGSTSGSVTVNNNIFTVTGLDYTQSHTISVSGTSVICPGLEQSIQAVYTFNTASLTISGLTPSLTCSNPSLPVTLMWTIEEGTQTSSDPSVPLNPPIIGMPMISYMYMGSNEVVTDTSTSISSYILPNPSVSEDVTFTVSVTNVASLSTTESTSLTVSALIINTGTVESQGCLTITVSSECMESPSEFAVLLIYGVGQCTSVTDFETPMTTTAPITSSSGVCIDVGTQSILNLCYTATLIHGSNAIMSQTNSNFQNCQVSTLQDQLGSGVTFTLSRAVTNGTVVHTTVAVLGCGSVIMQFAGDSQAVCVASIWRIGNNSCPVASFFIALLVVLTLLVVGVSIGVFSVLVVNKCRRSKRKTDTETEMRSPPPIYEEPDDVRHDPQTQENVAYGDLQFRQ